MEAGTRLMSVVKVAFEVHRALVAVSDAEVLVAGDFNRWLGGTGGKMPTAKTIGRCIV